MNTNNSAVVTPVELNKNLLNTLFKFNPLSKLKRFLVNKTGVEKTYYSLAEILTILKNIIRGEGMFDHANPSVIICSTDLERALNMKALHVTEIRDLVLSQITKVPDQSLREKFTQQIPNCGRTTINVSRTNLNLEAPRDSQPQPQPQPQPPRIIRTANISTAIYTDKNAKFTLKPKFLKVVQLVPGTDLKQTIFSYEEVTLLLSKYILSRKDDIFDPRNIKLALVANDPIGDAFGVKAFHRCQVNNLLRSQLIPVNPDCPPDLAVVTQNNGSPGVNVLVTEKHVPIVSARSAGTQNTSSSGPSSSAGQCYPAFPALSKASSLPASLLNPSEEQNRTRKRNSSGEGEDKAIFAKQAKTTSQEGNCSVVIRQANDSDVSETETIYSEQGYETIKVADQTQTSESEEEEEDTTRNYHDVEYDIESGEEEERPPQAMGKGVYSSAENTDTDVEDRPYNEPLIETRKIEQMMESVYWGDSEDDVKMTKAEEKEPETFDSGLDNVNLWQCSSCKTPNKPTLEQVKFKNFLCSKCWNLRKGWVPERPKFKKKSRKTDNKLKTVQKIIMSDTETDGASDRPRFDSKASISSQDSGIGSQEFELLSQEEEHTKEFPGQSLVVNHFSSVHGAKLPRSISLDSSNGSSVAGRSSDLGDSGSLSDPKDFPGSPMSLDSGCFPSSDSIQGTSQLCTLCCQRPKDASFIHGRLGHQVCCYPCAKKLWKKQATCPVCRRKVDRIIRIIQA